MDYFTLLIILLSLAIGFAILYFFFRQELIELKRSLDLTRDTVSSNLASNTRDIHTRLLDATTAIGELKREAGAFTEVSRSMQELHEFLRSPKLRGNIGEMVLGDLISQLFPRSSYSTQYQFKSGDKVDLAIKTDAGILPIDSKFPMENFQRLSSATGQDKETFRRAFVRDIRTHVKSIAGKYILPAENTLDFALMYIPSESVFYELVREDDLMEYARRERVYPVSPNTLYAALQTILLSFEGRKIESKAKEVFQSLRGISQDFKKTQAELATLGSHLSRASSKYAEVDTSFTALNQKITQARAIGEGTAERQLED